jgi:hypothetical protein
MKDSNFDYILHYLKYNKWPPQLQPQSKGEEKKYKNKKKELKKEAHKYFLKNDTLYIRIPVEEQEVTIINDETGNGKVQNNEELVEGEDYEVSTVTNYYEMKVIPMRDQKSLIQSYHGHESTNHWGRDRVMAAMRRDRIYWHGQWKDV